MDFSPAGQDLPYLQSVRRISLQINGAKSAITDISLIVIFNIAKSAHAIIEGKTFVQSLLYHCCTRDQWHVLPGQWMIWTHTAPPNESVFEELQTRRNLGS